MTSNDQNVPISGRRVDRGWTRAPVGFALSVLEADSRVGSRDRQTSPTFDHNGPPNWENPTPKRYKPIYPPLSSVQPIDKASLNSRKSKFAIRSP